ncbi:MAG: hypothetical protein FWB91_00015 [Defluviitaleaceae bacterium]|nr:hypothetical protein [Defluviitaleaceae bacterium]
MSANEVQRVIEEVMARNYPPPKQKMEFSKKVLLGALFFVGLFIIVSTVAWFLTGDWPREIATFFIAPFIGIASYNFKSGYENRPKIQGGDGQ